jgi:quinol monooxygenase YgiN
MHVQIVQFCLKDMTEEAFRAVCDQLAPTLADVPGLLSKIWLASPPTNTYGGVYTWSDRAAMEAYTVSDLFAAVAAHPNFAGVSSTDFDVLEGPTRVTRGPPGLARGAGGAAGAASPDIRVGTAGWTDRPHPHTRSSRARQPGTQRLSAGGAPVAALWDVGPSRRPPGAEG